MALYEVSCCPCPARNLDCSCRELCVERQDLGVAARPWCWSRPRSRASASAEVARRLRPAEPPGRMLWPPWTSTRRPPGGAPAPPCRLPAALGAVNPELALGQDGQPPRLRLFDQPSCAVRAATDAWKHLWRWVFFLVLSSAFRAARTSSPVGYPRDLSSCGRGVQ
jgi:hypothetical protein